MVVNFSEGVPALLHLLCFHLDLSEGVELFAFVFVRVHLLICVVLRNVLTLVKDTFFLMARLDRILDRLVVVRDIAIIHINIFLVDGQGHGGNSRLKFEVKLTLLGNRSWDRVWLDFDSSVLYENPTISLVSFLVCLRGVGPMVLILVCSWAVSHATRCVSLVID